MDNGGGAAARHVGPPRTLDVQQFAAARASEVEGLYNALKAQQEKGKLSLTTPRHLRRRTTSHNRRLPFRWRNNAAPQTGKKKKNEKTKNDKGSLQLTSLPQGNVGPTPEEESSCKRKPEKRIPSRRVRRRIELQGVRDGTASCMRDGTRRLATHVWHAKRFPMTKTWGYCLPQGLPGRGRGSKAVFKWVEEAAVLHDASYVGLIELLGTEDAILRILCQTLEPPPGLPTSGLFYGNAVLHNVGKAPREAIAPVTTLWRPSSSEGVGTSELSSVGKLAEEERQLWIWVHSSAFDNALLALSTACEGQGLDDRRGSVKCRSRRGELARLDILGKKALQVLQKVLRPIPRKLATIGSTDIAEEVNIDMTATSSPNVSHQPLSARMFAKADGLPAAAVLALDVHDPRDTPRSFYSGTEANFSESVSSDGNLPGDTPSMLNYLIHDETQVQNGKSLVDLIEDIGVTRWKDLHENGFSKEVSDSPYLWSPDGERRVAALSQKAFSEKRRQRRKSYFSDVYGDFLPSNLEAGALDSSSVEKSGACPVLLLKRAHSRASASGWSLIMPITWVQAFWVPLVFAGGHVIGLRERHWLATDAGLPYFPHDFPDCPSHAQHLAIENAAFNSANQARPPSKRSPPFAMSPLQTYIMYAYRDNPPDSSGRTAAVAFEMIDEERGEQFMEEKCTTPAGCIPRLTDVDGDTAMTEAGSLIARESPPQVSVIVASESRNVDGDAEKAAAGNAVTNSPISPVGCQNLHRVNFPKSSLAGDSSSLIESLPDTVSSLEVAAHDIDGAILHELANPEGDTPMIGTGTMVSGSLASPSASQTMDGVGILDFTVPLSYDAINEGSPFQDRVPSLPVHSVDGAVDPVLAMTAIEALVTDLSESLAPWQGVDGVFIPENSGMKGDTGQTVDGLMSKAIVKTDTGPTVDGVSVPELPKPLGGNAGTEIESLSDRVPPLPVASRSVDEAVVLGVTYLDGDSEMVGTDTEVAQLPSSEMPHKPAEGLSVQQFTKLHSDDATVLDDPQYGVNSSLVASQFEQPVVDARERERKKSGQSSLGDKAFSAEEMIGPGPTESHNLDLVEVVESMTDPRGRDQSSVLPSSPGDHRFLGLNSNMKSTTASPTVRIFVARTVEALMMVFSGKGLQHALLLCSGLMNIRSVQHGLRKGTLEWRASYEPVGTSACTSTSKIHGMVGGHGKDCYVRVLIVVPRKGVLKENGHLCSPTKDDFDAFLSRSQHWQGVEASWLSPQAKELKGRKGKRKEKERRKQKVESAKSTALQPDTDAEEFAKSTLTPLEVGYEDGCTREAIGCITSIGPQGSSWSGIGICKVSSLIKLRAMQWQDQRWWNKKEIFLLAGNRLSPILRPVLVSIVLEIGPEEDTMW